MANEFLHNIDVDQLKIELRMDVPDIARLVGISENAVYKWAWSKDKNGARPSYNALVLLLENGASINTLFGISLNDKPVSDAVPEEFNTPGFRRGVMRALEEMKAKGLLP